jgi:hypothetical protein
MSIGQSQNQIRPDRVANRLRMVVCLVLGVWGGLSSVDAGEVRLKNGFRIEGLPFQCQGLTAKVVRESGTISSHPIWGIEDGFRRYFVARSQVEGAPGRVVGGVFVPPSGVKMDADLSRYETFTLQQPRRNRRTTPSVIGSYTAGPFSEHGRRTVNLAGLREPVIEGITKITPHYLWIEAVNLQWEHGIATTSIPPDTLHAILQNAIDTSDPTDRLAVCNFYIAAQMYEQAAAELKSLLADHPDLKDQFSPVENNLRQQQARVLLTELRRRQAAGQHQLAMKAAKQFPIDKLGAEARRDIRDLEDDYESRRDLLEMVQSRLGDLQAELPVGPLQKRIAAIRGELRDQIDFNSIDRLQPFINLQGLTAKEQLALAFSGWLLGAANAITDLDETLNLWQARFLILQIMRTDQESTRQNLLQDLKKLEGIGHERVRQLIPQLPPLIESPDLVSSRPLTVELAARGEDKPTAYTVILPPEYSPNHLYPMIVTLRPQRRNIENQLSFWAGTQDQPGQAQRHGYIVIAPHYIDQDHPKYEHDARSHQVVLDAIVDARQRFKVDSDRVFLTGHGMGGDAAIDIGMSHPDYFAGVLPFTALVSDISNWYWKNSVGLGWYFVTGELDRNSLDHNAKVLNLMMRNRHNLVIVEYIGRGYEHYYEEIHRVFEWMSLQKRNAWPTVMEFNVKRPRDNRFYWVHAFGLPNVVTRPSTNSRPMELNVRVSDGNTMRITSGASFHDIFLSPKIVDFDKKLTVLKGSRKKFNGFLTPSIEDTLDALRETGDRQQLRWQRLRID